MVQEYYRKTFNNGDPDSVFVEIIIIKRKQARGAVNEKSKLNTKFYIKRLCDVNCDQLTLYEGIRGLVSYQKQKLLRNKISVEQYHT